MQTIKEIVHDIANHLPEQATVDDAMYALYVRQKLDRSLQAAKEGNVTSQEERGGKRWPRLTGQFGGRIKV